MTSLLHGRGGKEQELVLCSCECNETSVLQCRYSKHFNLVSYQALAKAGWRSERKAKQLAIECTELQDAILKCA